MLELRMQRAYFLIKNGYSVFQTASLCGYRSTSYFIYKYRRYYGTTPLNNRMT
ncbi:helix-turn-helix domain-containing protein [Escherichia coli]|uniref:helix-turn-helix domain-containing protein n=1 Tax=Escherichia coli TaxID=562 RepID=UPI003339BE7F